MQSGLVFNIQRYCVQDGPGIRTTVFLKGCPLDCPWCHNPEGRSSEPEVRVWEGRCVRCGRCAEVCPQRVGGNGRPAGPDAACRRCGACVSACPAGARQMVGRWWTAAEVVAEVLKDRVFYDDSGGGVTLSGGEPLMQPEFARAVLEACRAEGIGTALDTCGFGPQADLLALAPWVDLFLYDVKIVDDRLHPRFTGVSNARILENLRALGDAGAAIWIRVPLVPGFNDAEEHIEAAARLAASIPSVRQVDVLPYHRLGARKGGAREGSPLPAESPSPQRLNEVADRFRALGLPTRTHG